MREGVMLSRNSPRPPKAWRANSTHGSRSSACLSLADPCSPSHTSKRSPESSHVTTNVPPFRGLGVWLSGRTDIHTGLPHVSPEFNTEQCCVWLPQPYNLARTCHHPHTPHTVHKHCSYKCDLTPRTTSPTKCKQSAIPIHGFIHFGLGIHTIVLRGPCSQGTNLGLLINVETPINK